MTYFPSRNEFKFGRIFTDHIIYAIDNIYNLFFFCFSPDNPVNKVSGSRPDIIIDTADVLSKQSHSDKLGTNKDEENGK